MVEPKLHSGMVTLRSALVPALKVNGSWRYVYRAIDQNGQVIDVLVSVRRDAAAARRFFTRALGTLKVIPTEVVTDAAPIYPGVLDELLSAAWHHVERYANNPIEADHGQLKHRRRPMRGLRTDRTAQVVIAGHAFVQNLRRGHYELAVDACPALRVGAAFSQLAQASWLCASTDPATQRSPGRQCQR
jgi:transposase, IS6 family